MPRTMDHRKTNIVPMRVTPLRMAIYGLALFLTGWGTHGALLRTGKPEDAGIVADILGLPISVMESLISGLNWVVVNALLIVRAVMDFIDFLLQLM